MGTETVLIVDDDDDIREMLKDRLEFLEHRVLTAVNGKEGVDAIVAERPGLVLLDIQMPIMDGFDVLREVADRGIDVPVIVITANGTIQRAVEAMQLGAFDFLMKPFQSRDVEQRVSRALRESALRRENQRLQNELARAQAKLLEEMKGELDAAHNMQMALMPDTDFSLDGYDISATCLPSRQVGGDYYRFIDRTGEDTPTLGIFLADVSGKGMQAATVALRLNEMLRYEAEGRDRGEEILAGLDRSLRGRIPSDMFSTCGIAFLETEARRVRFTSAASPEVYRFRAVDESVTALEAYGFPVGLPFEPPGASPFGSTEVTLDRGDCLVFASDGIEEAMAPGDRFYGEDRLKALIRTEVLAGKTAGEIKDRIVDDVNTFVGEDGPRDDLTVVVIRVL